MSKIWAGLAAVVVILLAIGGYSYWRGQTRETALLPTSAPAQPAVQPTAQPATQQAAKPPTPAPSSPGPQARADDRILGKTDAPITIFEFASLTCPHCADFEANTLPQLKTEWIDTGKARLIYRDFPLDPMAVKAATLARCAPPEQFYGFVDVLFRGQPNWANQQRIDDALGKLAKLAGMGDDKFTACMKDDNLQKQVLAERLEAEQQFNVESTPTFFINGAKVTGALPYAEFEKELSKAAPK
jgi:protein-disulfide isomerase